MRGLLVSESVNCLMIYTWIYSVQPTLTVAGDLCRGYAERRPGTVEDESERPQLSNRADISRQVFSYGCSYARREFDALDDHGLGTSNQFVIND
jgi:hypothetical protein